METISVKTKNMRILLQ